MGALAFKCYPPHIRDTSSKGGRLQSAEIHLAPMENP